MQMVATRPKLETVEAARGIAALAVVVFHTNSAAQLIGHRFIAPFAVGEHGVDFFFVLSGFIIFFVHGADIGHPTRAGDYLMKRFIRLFPILWIVSGGCLLIKALFGTPESLSVVGTSLLLYPSLERPYPLVLWTLRHELLFYVAFLAFILNRRLGFLLFGVWTAACLAQLTLAGLGRPVQGLSAFFVSTYQLDFVMGAILAAMHRSRTFRASFAPLLIGIVLLVICLVGKEMLAFSRSGVSDYTSLPATAGTLLLGLAFAVVLHGLLCIEKIVRVPRIMVLLGGASYAIYLVHTPLNWASRHLAIFLPSGGSHLFIGLLGVVGGIALHMWIEKPITRSLRKLLLDQRTRSSIATGDR